MDLIMIMEMFPDQAACIAYLEQLRWQGSPECPHCRIETKNSLANNDVYTC